MSQCTGHYCDCPKITPVWRIGDKVKSTTVDGLFVVLSKPHDNRVLTARFQDGEQFWLSVTFLTRVYGYVHVDQPGNGTDLASY